MVKTSNRSNLKYFLKKIVSHEKTNLFDLDMNKKNLYRGIYRDFLGLINNQQSTIPNSGIDTSSVLLKTLIDIIYNLERFIPKKKNTWINDYKLNTIK